MSQYRDTRDVQAREPSFGGSGWSGDSTDSSQASKSARMLVKGHREERGPGSHRRLQLTRAVQTHQSQMA